MTTNRPTIPLAALSVTLLLGLGTVIACGGGDEDDDDVASLTDDETAGSDDTATDDAATDEEILDWVECMRGEGIDIPDPTRDSSGNLVLGGGDSSSGGQSVSGDQDDVAAAHETCGQPPGVGPTDISGEDQQEIQDAAMDFAQCMRDEGIDDFPDPDFSDSGPGGAPEGAAPGSDDEDTEAAARSINAPFGEIDFDDAATREAYESCQEILVGAGGGPGGGPAAGGGAAG